MKDIPGLEVAGRYIPPKQSPTMVWFSLDLNFGINLEDWSKVRNPDIAIHRIVGYLDECNIGLAGDRLNNARVWIAKIVQRISDGETRISVSLPYDDMCDQTSAMNIIFMVMGWLNMPFRIVTVVEQ